MCVKFLKKFMALVMLMYQPTDYRKVVDCFADLSCLIRQRGCRTAEDNRIVRLRTKMQLEQNREEVTRTFGDVLSHLLLLIHFF